MIKDPRNYTINYPNSNILINLAINVLDKKASFAELKWAIANVLKNENDALVNVALNLSPSFIVSNIIWQALHQVINNVEDEVTAQIFAIPIILVAGSKAKTQINGSLDVNRLNQLFLENQVFGSQADSFISGKLIDPGSLNKIKSSQLYYWSRNIKNASLWLPVNLAGSSIEVLNEGVFLRFLIGITISNDKMIINHDAYRNSSMKLMQFINEELHNDQVTLFPIPFEPVSLSESYLIGDSKRKEIAITVAISNIVRKIREEGLTPAAVIDGVDEALKISISAVGKPELYEASLWNLTKFEDYTKCVTTLTTLLQDMQVDYTYAN